MISTLKPITNDPSVSFSTIDSAIAHSQSMDIQETSSFLTRELVYLGGAIATPYGTFALTSYANTDVLNRGGVSGSCQNFMHNKDLAQALGSACNKYLTEGPERDKPIKVVHRTTFPGEVLNGYERVAVGIPSSRYSLLKHETVLTKIKSCELPVQRLAIGPAELDLIVSLPTTNSSDRVGQVVKVGLNLKNSVGNRWCALSMSVATFRLVCANGAVAPVGAYGMTMKHSGGRILNEGFRDRVLVLSQKANVLAKALPLITSEPIKEYIPVLKNSLPCAVGSTPAKAYLEKLKNETFLGDVWNDITAWPHRLVRQDQKNKCEELGFRLLIEAIKRRN